MCKKEILISNFPGGNQENHQKTSIRITGVAVEIQIGDLMNTRQKRYRLNQFSQCFRPKFRLVVRTLFRIFLYFLPRKLP
jgi:hypothetical protein